MAAAAAAAAARRSLLYTVSTRPRITQSAFGQGYRSVHGAAPSSGSGKKFATGDDLSEMKRQIIEELMDEQHKVQLALKDVEKEVGLTKLRVENQESRIVSSVELSKVTVEASHAKNALYMVALGFAMCSGIFSTVKLYQLCAEMFPYGLFPLPDEPTEN